MIPPQAGESSRIDEPTRVRKPYYIIDLESRIRRLSQLHNYILTAMILSPGMVERQLGDVSRFLKEELEGAEEMVGDWQRFHEDVL